jgi:hypothetical protein
VQVARRTQTDGRLIGEEGIHVEVARARVYAAGLFNDRVGNVGRVAVVENTRTVAPYNAVDKSGSGRGGIDGAAARGRIAGKAAIDKRWG